LAPGGVLEEKKRGMARSLVRRDHRETRRIPRGKKDILGRAQRKEIREGEQHERTTHGKTDLLRSKRRKAIKEWRPERDDPGKKNGERSQGRL